MMSKFPRSALAGKLCSIQIDGDYDPIDVRVVGIITEMDLSFYVLKLDNGQEMILSCDSVVWAVIKESRKPKKYGKVINEKVIQLRR